MPKLKVPQGVAKYRALYDVLLPRLAQLSKGEKFYSENLLVAQYGVSRITVRRALAMLVREKRVKAIKGSGTYVR